MTDLKERISAAREVEVVAETLAKMVSKLNAASEHIATLIQKDPLITDGDDARDAAEAAIILEGIRRGEIETFPDTILGRLLDGENAVRVFREYRGIRTEDLARAAGISRPYLTMIETNKREPMFGVMVKIARALDVSLDLLAPAPDNENKS